MTVDWPVWIFKKTLAFQEIEMENVRIENGSWFFIGEGADGYREYRMGPANEVTRNQ